MGKNYDFDVRSHSQEREWLRNLGGGNVVEGVQNLVQQIRGKDKWSYDYDYQESKRGRFLRWRNK